MEPYYQDDWVSIWHGDCREVLPDGAGLDAEVLLTDPPYGINGGRGGDARDFAKGAYVTSGWCDDEDYVRRVVVPVIDGLLSVVNRGAITPGVRNLFHYPRPDDMGCLWTPAGATHGPWGFQTFHPVLFYGRDFRAGKGALPSGKQVTESAERNGHPCPKPLGAWKWLLDKVSLPGEVILDPFMGSGTTLRAAKDLGRRAIGIEIEERYCEIAVRRMGQEVLNVG